MFLKLRLMKSYFDLAKDPSNTVKVFRLSDLLLNIASKDTLAKISTEYAQQYPITYQEFIDHKDIKGIDYIQFKDYCDDTLGKMYYNHMHDNNLEVDFFEKCKKDIFVDYLRNKIRATHDVWHVLTGNGTAWDDEVALQSFYAGQKTTGLNTILVSVGYLHIALTGQFDKFAELSKKVDLNNQRGLQASNLLEADFSKLWDKNINLVRQELLII
jgi:ubiquinone biosynthesis protein COQ4